MNDPVDVVRHVVPSVEVPPELLERVRNDLMTTIVESDHQETNRPPRRRRRWVAPIAATAVLATAAAGWAAVRGDSSTNTSLQCPTSDGNTAGIQAVTGDPVADCTAEWRRSDGTEPPPMTAYDDGSGGVTVLLEGDAPPDGFVALEPGPYQDTDVIELTAALDDVGTGLPSGCFDEAAARDLTQRELTRLQLTDWTITVDESRPPTGSTSCAYFVVHADQRQVQLIGMGPPPADASPYTAYASELDNQLSAECVGLDAAADLARSIAAATDVSSATDVAFTEEAGLLVLHTVDDPSADCTRADVVVGGAVEVTLRGPAA